MARRATFVGVLSLVGWLLLPSPGAAQHEGHNMGTPTKRAPQAQKKAAKPAPKKAVKPAPKRQPVKVSKKRPATVRKSSASQAAPRKTRKTAARPTSSHAGHQAAEAAKKSPPASAKRATRGKPETMAAPHAMPANDPMAGHEGHVKPEASKRPSTTVQKPSRSTTKADDHKGHAEQSPVARPRSTPPSAAPQGHAGHAMPNGGKGAMAGMSMDTMMAMQGMLAESRKYSQAALKSLDTLASALEDARQAPDRASGLGAMERARKALETVREHLVHSQYSIDMSGDVQRLEPKGGGQPPHLGHDAPQGMKTEPKGGKKVVPAYPGHGGAHQQTSPSTAPEEPGGEKNDKLPSRVKATSPIQPPQNVATDRSEQVPFSEATAGLAATDEFPSLVRGTLGMPGSPGLSATVGARGHPICQAVSEVEAPSPGAPRSAETRPSTVRRSGGRPGSAAAPVGGGR